jgi:hypothetical protein
MCQSRRPGDCRPVIHDTTRGHRLNAMMEAITTHKQCATRANLILHQTPVMGVPAAMPSSHETATGLNRRPRHACTGMRTCCKPTYNQLGLKPAVCAGLEGAAPCKLVQPTKTKHILPAQATCTVSQTSETHKCHPQTRTPAPSSLQPTGALHPMQC